jgi:hypothetical protein
MNTVNKWTTYVSHPDVAWIVEKSGIHLINKNTGKSEFILYPEAMLWELLSGNKPYKRLVNIIAAVVGLSQEASEYFISRKVGDWTKEGWLVAQKSNG